MPDGGNWKELLYASERGDLDLMRYHLRMGIDPNYQHPEFLTTPQIEAARNNHPAALKLLLEHGADPHAASILDGETAQSVAKLYRHKAITKLLPS